MLNILFFTNDPVVQGSVEKNISGQDRSSLTAPTYQEAVNILGNIFISLMVVDFKLSHIKCRALLEHVRDLYPDIPVVTVSASQLDKEDALNPRSTSYVANPFDPNAFNQVIEAEIQNLIQGGTITNVSPPLFAQLLEMEQRTCILRIFEKKTKNGGLLVFRDGMLVDARYKGFRAMDAACRVLAWEEADVFLQNANYQETETIDTDLKSIIMRSVHMKDEGHASLPKQQSPAPATSQPKKQPVSTTKNLATYLAKEMGGRSGVDDIYQDPSLTGTLDHAQSLGDAFDLGRLKLVYSDNESTGANIIVAGSQPTKLKLNAHCPRDRIIQSITRY